MRRDWATESSGDGYGQRRKMKKLREVATVGLATAGKVAGAGGRKRATTIATGKRGGRRQQKQRLRQRTTRLQAADGASTEALGSTSKGQQRRLRRAEGEAGQQQRRLQLHGLMRAAATAAGATAMAALQQCETADLKKPARWQHRAAVCRQ
ncbi:hypothetical protein GW17_00006708 [Ensete ventricosum]|nr:hypothetical protein GW17_00006708 [Ensete ventricosum]